MKNYPPPLFLYHLPGLGGMPCGGIFDMELGGGPGGRGLAIPGGIKGGAPIGPGTNIFKNATSLV